MVLVFAFAITPKRFLHSLVAHHKDTYNKLTEGKTEVTKTGFNCQIDNLVATSHFTGISEKPEIELSSVFVSHKERLSFANLFPAHTFFSLRGPPALLSI